MKRIEGETSGMVTEGQPTQRNSQKFLIYIGLPAIASALVLAIVGLFSGALYRTLEVNAYLVWHNLVEFTSATVSVSIFFIGWYSHRETKNQRDLFLGVAFLVVGAVDVMHLLSFPGMPAFVSENSTNKAIDYWITARLVQAAALAGYGFIPTMPSSRRFVRPVSLSAALAFIAVLFYVVTYLPHLIPPMFVAGKGLTSTKIALEYLVIFITAFAIVKITYGIRAGGSYQMMLLTGLTFFIFSELSFTLYASAYDTYNLLGHIFKIGSVTSIFLAIFVSGISQPFYERKKAEDEIRRLNVELEQRVVERTAQLEAANKELEAFSYSVSHDLRAPLRSIDGFSQVLLEDYGGKVDEQGRGYLQRVRNATQQMAQLIDDLLKLSRVTRSEMKFEAVDLSALTRRISERLQSGQPERLVEFTVAPGIVVNGDVALLQIVLENLIGNAWKFTAKHPSARIEFGVAQQDGRQAYFVRDDGAGFDMTYADKLFVPFQRLHATAEFPGTGIGLATVQRIIHRHGGRLWAEGEVEKGATFYFTIETQKELTI